MSTHNPTHEDLKGLVSRPIARVSDEREYPKFVEVHPSHIVRVGDHVSTPAFPIFHIDRNTKVVTVQVQSAIEEHLAIVGSPMEPAHPGEEYNGA